MKVSDKKARGNYNIRHKSTEPLVSMRERVTRRDNKRFSVVRILTKARHDGPFFRCKDQSKPDAIESYPVLLGLVRDGFVTKQACMDAVARSRQTKPQSYLNSLLCMASFLVGDLERHHPGISEVLFSETPWSLPDMCEDLYI